MSIIKAFLYTILAFVFWTIIQLAILLPIVYLIGKPDDFTHIYGITRILSVIGSFFLIYFFFRKPNFDLKRALKIQNYNPRIYLYLPLIAIGLLLLNKPFWDFTKIIEYYQGIPINNYVNISSNNSALIYNLISAILIAPIIEELFYRKFLLDKLSKNNSPIIAIITSSLCFSIMHIETPNNLIPTFFSGIILGLIYLKTKKSGYCIMLHFIVNLIIVTTSYMGTSYDNWLIGYNFDLIYWLLFGIGIFITLIGIKKITTANTV
ncbi:type II CAAX endopeptidase family protein [Lacinutrix neustonica]|uniref:Type II CAAX endopeptidase family protein n=1 Tax=Lacinutrix neustonica TaxID=2980107 RepID=A0A9E8SF37_9FLAO|nr:type II CAAX endopeptidase family protein [Lacinutrix neustonica]WAC02974.1 type II CAAX endopeptidase family protein [Lacinutrix neustonica]